MTESHQREIKGNVKKHETKSNVFLFVTFVNRMDT